MDSLHYTRLTSLSIVLLCAMPAMVPAQSTDAVVEEALSAAPAPVAENATVMDWEQNVLKEGSNGWVCFPSPPRMDSAPMCMDGPWQSWAESWMNREPVEIGQVGVSYMLQGDAGASNIDPFAEGPTPDNEWVQEGPHLMIIVPDLSALEGLPTDPENGGPYVMWQGTPYAHIMVPLQ